MKAYEMTSQELAGRVALVTGAGRNIGSSIAKSLARAGAAVIVNTRSSEAEARTVVSEIEASGGSAMAATADVVDSPAVERMVLAAVSLVIGPDSFLQSWTEQIVALAIRHAVPLVTPYRDLGASDDRLPCLDLVPQRPDI